MSYLLYVGGHFECECATQEGLFRALNYAPAFVTVLAFDYGEASSSSDGTLIRNVTVETARDWFAATGSDFMTGLMANHGPDDAELPGIAVCLFEEVEALRSTFSQRAA